MDKTDKPVVDPIPPRLYKYRRWTDEFHRRMLTHNAVYFASARKFNDPFDCTIVSRFGPLTDEEALHYLTRYLRSNDPDITDAEIELGFKQMLKERMWCDSAHIESVGRLHQEQMYSRGIFTLTASNHNILLWAHYADSHRGFCVGFDSTALRAYFKRLLRNVGLDFRLHKIEYAKDYPTFDFFNMPSEDWFFKPLATKSCAWEYEEEFRYILMNKTNIQYSLDNGIIVEVIFGCEMPDEHKSEIKDILREKGAKVELFEARMKEKSFGLDFIRIDY